MLATRSPARTAENRTDDKAAGGRDVDFHLEFNLHVIMDWRGLEGLHSFYGKTDWTGININRRKHKIFFSIKNEVLFKQRVKKNIKNQEPAQGKMSVNAEDV